VDILGEYKAHTNWGEATLSVRADHSFVEVVNVNGQGERKISGTWGYVADGRSSGDHIWFTPFLWVAHDDQGEQVDRAEMTIGRYFPWSITIDSDPDYGIDFYKR
jgi:hypothetical protein